MKLAGKVAIVTGGAMGIGRAICRKLATEGAAVVIADINLDRAQATGEELAKEGFPVLVVNTDVADLDSHKKLVKQTVERFGRIDILVNNAGIQEKNADVLEVTPDIWDRTMNVNLKGVFFLSQTVIPIMLKSGGGSVINTASIAGQVFFPEIVTYNVSKAGVRGLTGVMALALAGRGIRVNAVAPGNTDTELNKGLFSVPGKREEIIRKTPIPRIGLPEDIAAAVVFLASDDASYVTGHTITVDGGWTLT